MKIVISSGHGLHVSGARGIINEVTEARRVTDRVAAILRTLGVEVYAFHENETRNARDNVNTIVRHHNGQERDLDVSVHFNAFEPTANPRGVEVLYLNRGLEMGLASYVSTAISKASGLRNRGAKHRTNLGFLNNTNRPSILLEVCFVDSEEDVRLYQIHFEEICQAIAKTLCGQDNASSETPKWPVSEENIRAMQDLGVISCPEYWRTITHVQYLNNLLANANRPGLLDRRIENGIPDISIAFDVLGDAGIIRSPEYWKNLISENAMAHLDELLINIANRCRIVLEKIIHAESRGEDIVGQTLVGNVIMNRHNNPSFPTGIYNIVFQSDINSAGVLVHQFAPVANGAYDAAIPSKSVKYAVDRVLSGCDSSDEALFFIANRAVAGSWHEQALMRLFTHGGHTFFR